MAQVHEKRIIHLDIKPDNFLLVQGVLKIIDLGLAKLLPPGKNYIGINIIIFFSCKILLKSTPNAWVQFTTIDFVFLVYNVHLLFIIKLLIFAHINIFFFNIKFFLFLNFLFNFKFFFKCF